MPNLISRTYIISILKLYKGQTCCFGEEDSGFMGKKGENE